MGEENKKENPEEKKDQSTSATPETGGMSLGAILNESMQDGDIFDALAFLDSKPESKKKQTRKNDSEGKKQEKKTKEEKKAPAENKPAISAAADDGKASKSVSEALNLSVPAMPDADQIRKSEEKKAAAAKKEEKKQEAVSSPGAVPVMQALQNSIDKPAGTLNVNDIKLTPEEAAEPVYARTSTIVPAATAKKETPKKGRKTAKGKKKKGFAVKVIAMIAAFGAVFAIAAKVGFSDIKKQDADISINLAKGNSSASDSAEDGYSVDTQGGYEQNITDWLPKDQNASFADASYAMGNGEPLEPPTVYDYGSTQYGDGVSTDYGSTGSQFDPTQGEYDFSAFFPDSGSSSGGQGSSNASQSYYGSMNFSFGGGGSWGGGESGGSSSSGSYYPTVSSGGGNSVSDDSDDDSEEYSPEPASESPSKQTAQQRTPVNQGNTQATGSSQPEKTTYEAPKLNTPSTGSTNFSNSGSISNTNFGSTFSQNGGGETSSTGKIEAFSSGSSGGISMAPPSGGGSGSSFDGSSGGSGGVPGVSSAVDAGGSSDGSSSGGSGSGGSGLGSMSFGSGNNSESSVNTGASSNAAETTANPSSSTEDNTATNDKSDGTTSAQAEAAKTDKTDNAVQTSSAPTTVAKDPANTAAGTSDKKKCTGDLANYYPGQSGALPDSYKSQFVGEGGRFCSSKDGCGDDYYRYYDDSLTYVITDDCNMNVIITGRQTETDIATNASVTKNYVDTYRVGSPRSGGGILRLGITYSNVGE